MRKKSPFDDLLAETKILRPPKHSLTTFGSTTLNYILLSALPEPGQCRLREGCVTAQRPAIVTAEQWRERFQGFGEQTAAFESAMEKTYGDAFRSLEYNFRNELQQTSIEQEPLSAVAERIVRAMDQEDAQRKALLQGPDTNWTFSVMKFIIDTSTRSFPSNVRELEERGFFDPQGRDAAKRQWEIERLFQDAQRHPDRIKTLAQRLKEWGCFEKYEDRFFALINKH
jgi:hypothetical protein